MKVAIALFVKDEKQDIASWITWHTALGVNKLFIFDDHSSDGTYEIIQTASNLYNIELYQTDPNTINHFYQRQKEAYHYACNLAIEQEFDWLGFLDGDEYLSLEKAKTIQEFLSSFDQYNGIALNWRIYGSSHRVLKTHLAPYEAYTSHCNPSLTACNLVKSFIKPQYYTFVFRDPHRFNLREEQYADALGNPVQWDQSTKQIIWDSACINHYICRSMEDYIARIKRRINTDLNNSTCYWEYYNKNNINHLENPIQIAQSNYLLNNIKKECVKEFIQQIAKNETPEEVLLPLDVRIVSLETYHGMTIGLKNHEEKLCTYKNNDHFIKVFGILNINNPNFIFLFYIKENEISNIPFIIEDEKQRLSSYIYYLEEVEGNLEFFSLRSLDTNKLMSFSADSSANVTIDKDNALEYEYIKLNEENITLNTGILPQRIHNLNDFLTYIKKYSNRITYTDFLLAFNQLNTEQRNEIFHFYPTGKQISWI